MKNAGKYWWVNGFDSFIDCRDACVRSALGWAVGLGAVGGGVTGSSGGLRGAAGGLARGGSAVGGVLGGLGILATCENKCNGTVCGLRS